MCTAVTYEGMNFYFGRNLDLDVSFNEKVTILHGSLNFGSGMKQQSSLTGR